MATVLELPAECSRIGVLPRPRPFDVEPSAVPQGPCIPRITDDMPRPLFSVMIPTYNAPPNYLERTLRSVLQQDLGRHAMEIVVVDNCSTLYDPEPMIRRLAGERVEIRRQQRNIGAVCNFNSCIAHARGRWVHILPADDFVRPGFYRNAQRAIAANADIAAYVTRHVFVNGEGDWLSLSELLGREPSIAAESFVRRQLVSQQMQFVTTIVRRSAYEELGAFRAMFEHCPDWDMWNRLVLTKRVFYEPRLFGCYRVHDSSVTAEMVATGRNVREERRCLRTYCALLPRRDAKQICRAGMGQAGIRALRNAWRNWRVGRGSAALHQFGQSLRCFASAALISIAYRRLPVSLGIAHQGT